MRIDFEFSKSARYSGRIGAALALRGIPTVDVWMVSMVTMTTLPLT